MTGSYLQTGDLGRSDDRVEAHPACHDGVLGLDGHFELHSVERWILKNHGIALVGPDPQDLPFTVDWDLIVKKMRVNLNTYWASWTRRPDRVAKLLSDWGVQWAVLGVLRQFYSFRENAITTKRRAGEYALTCVSPRWHRLIQEAIDIRQGGQRSMYRSRIARAVHYDYLAAEIVPVLQRLRGQGKIRFIAISERFGPDPQHAMLQRALRDDVWDVVMVGFNLLNQSARGGSFP